MRIISGKFKGRRISPPRNLPVRPTTDMSKEALFNVLNNHFNFEGLKVLDLLPKEIWDNIFDALQPQDQSDELKTVTIVNGIVQVPGMLNNPTSNSRIKDTNDKHVAAYFKKYITDRIQKKSNPSPRTSYIYDIRNITSIVTAVTQAATQGRNIVIEGEGFTYQQYIHQIISFWYVAITKAMTVRMQKYVDFIKELDVAVDGLLWPLLTSSTGQTSALYKGEERSYDQLNELLDKKLDELKEKRSPAYDLIAVPVQTMKERIAAHDRYIREFRIGPATNTNLTSKKRLTPRDKLPQPVPGLPVCMSLDAYTTPYIFRFTELEKQKAYDVEEAYNAVAKSLYNADFMRELKHIVETGHISTETDAINPTVEAEKLITTAEDECTTTGNKRKAKPNRSNNGNDNNNSNNNASAMSTSRIPNAKQITIKRPRFTAARTLSTPPSPQQTTGSQGGTRNHRKHRNHRNHRTRKQKKNKKTRKNKKLTKRF